MAMIMKVTDVSFDHPKASCDFFSEKYHDIKTADFRRYVLAPTRVCRVSFLIGPCSFLFWKFPSKFDDVKSGPAVAQGAILNLNLRAVYVFQPISEANFSSTCNCAKIFLVFRNSAKRLIWRIFVY